MPSGLTVVTSDRPAVLAEQLALDLGRVPLSPLEDELIVVQSLGMERWVRHQLALGHGCAASLRFPFPAAFCYWLAATVAFDGDQGPLDDRFDRDALTWRILQLLHAGIADESEFSPLRAFVASGDTRQRLGLARRIADRFDEYQLYRADVLLAWERGEAVPDDVAHVRWQSKLWRRLCTDSPSPRYLARWFTQAIERLERSEVAPPGLPRRISVFGVSTLPPPFIRLLHAVARFVPVRIYVVAPPRSTWHAGERANETRVAQPHDAPMNPLFAAFGGAARSLLTLLNVDGVTLEEHHDANAVAGTSCLMRLQDNVRRGVARGPEDGLEQPVALAPTDDSLTVHVCHSPMREMEVLRDQLFAAFAADPTLRPHDVLVLVPDTATYTPFIDAVFGVGEPELPRIPYRVADRTLATESPFADAALRILRLVGARWTAAEIVELLDLPAVRRAAGLSEDGAERVVRWIEETEIRWGRDGAMRRERFGLPAIDANSWRAGLDRLLVGYAVGPEDGLITGVLPYAGDTIGEPDVLGAFVGWLERLFDTVDGWQTPRSMSEWSAALRDAFTVLLRPDDESEAQVFARLTDAIANLKHIEAMSGNASAMDVTVVRDWLERELNDASTGAGFLTGGMTFCAMKPMRSIPFRVIAMVGLEDAAFPRRERRAAYDLLAIEPRDGDRDRRADDEQLFLDTILSAGDRLILSYVGRSAKDNKPRASSVVVAQLLDIIDKSFTSTATDDAGRVCRARDAIIVEHRLQPFSPAYYATDTTSGADPRLFSYSRANARATAIAMADRRPVQPFVAGPLVSEGQPDARLELTLTDLIKCWTNPSKFFCQRVLGISLPDDEEPLGECEPMGMDGLTRYGVQDKILQRYLRGDRDLTRERDEAIARGDLPSGLLAGLWFDRLDSELRDLLERIGHPEFREPMALRIDASTWTLTGRIDGITERGLVQARPATRKPKDLIRAWITHVALSADCGECDSALFATDRDTKFGAVSTAREILDDLIGGYREALLAPLPIFENASWAHMHQHLTQERESVDPSAKPKGGRKAKTPLAEALEGFNGSEWRPGKADREDPYIALCWRGRKPLDGAAEEFVHWSERLWRPILTTMREEGKEAPA